MRHRTIILPAAVAGPLTEALAKQAGVPFVFDDGGRAAAGYRGLADDCVVRAVAIATGRPYQEIYDLVNQLGQRERPRAYRRRGRVRLRKRSSARTGVTKGTCRRLMEQIGGWTWVATMGIGTGCRVHLKADELPAGRLIVAVSKHWTAVVDGTIHDTHDPSRGGTRCVYGYWKAVL